jgi:hypothetical protein
MFAAELLAQDAARPVWQISGGALVGIVFWLAIALIVIVPSLAHYWAQVRKAEAEARLKEQMVERGFSPGEILAVINNNPAALRDTVPHSKGGAMTPSKLPPEHAHV